MLNASWHKRHPLPRNATIQQRIAWHLEHQKHCACRPIPPKLQEQMRALSGTSSPLRSPRTKAKIRRRRRVARR